MKLNFNQAADKLVREDNMPYFDQVKHAYTRLNGHPAQEILTVKKTNKLVRQWIGNMNILVREEPEAAKDLLKKIVNRPQDSYFNNSEQHPALTNATRALAPVAVQFYDNLKKTDAVEAYLTKRYDTLENQ